MDTIEIILLTAVVLTIIPFAVKTHIRAVKNEIMLAESKVRGYLTQQDFMIVSIISNQKEIKTKGLHIGIAIKAIVVKKNDIKLELILIHNSLSDKIKIVSEKYL